MVDERNAHSARRILLTLLPLLANFTPSYGQTWPLPPKKYDSRPTADSRCSSQPVKFCPSGLQPNFMPKMGDNDELYVYVMSHPDDTIQISRKDNKTGKILQDEYVSQHYALGFHHVPTGLNMTLEWYEMSQLINCTVPSDLSKFPFLWCNQAAACISMGIDEKLWKDHGSLNKVSVITGDVFNRFANWTLDFNVSYPFYSPWTVMDKPGGQVWFEPLDRASFLIRTLQALRDCNASFDHTEPMLAYDKLIFYSQKPTPVPHKESSRGPLENFFRHYEKEGNLNSLVKYLQGRSFWWWTHPTFYHFFNDQYWQLTVHASWEPFRSPFEVERGKTYFEPFDRGSALSQALDALHKLNVSFDQSVSPLDYDLLVFYSHAGPSVTNDSAALTKFYKDYSDKPTLKALVEYLEGRIVWWIGHPDFYHFFNGQYWKLQLFSVDHPDPSPFAVVHSSITLPK